MPESNLILVRKWSEHRDAEAFKALAVQYAGMIFGTCRRILGNETEAEDAAQQCLEALTSVKPETAPHLGPWLHKTAVNISLTRLRSERRRAARESAFAQSAGAPQAPAWDDLCGFLDEAVAALPDKFRLPLVAHFYENQTHEAIARHMNLSRQAVGYRIEKGIDRVRKSLKRRGVLIAAMALTETMRANLAEAAPAALLTHGGKLALLGPPAGAATLPAALAATTSGLTAKLAVAGLASVLLLLGALLYPHFAEAPDAVPKTHTRAVTEPDAHESSSPADSEEAALGLPDLPGNAGETPSEQEETGRSMLICEVCLEDGTPAAGASVELARFDSLAWEKNPLRNRARKRTGVDGRAVFDRLPGGNYVARARQGNLFGVTLESVSLEKATLSRAIVPMRLSETSSGLVVNEQGEPVANATLSPCSIAATPSLVMKLARLAVPSLIEGEVHGPEAAITRAATDASGTFQFPTWEDTSLRFRVASPGYETLTTGLLSAGKSSRFVLQRGAALRGILLDPVTKAPLPGVEILAVTDDFPRDFYRATTGAQGQFEFRGLRNGPYSMLMNHESLALHPLQSAFRIEDGKDREEIFGAVPGANLKGRVLDAKTGVGIPDVTLRIAEGRSFPHRRTPVVTDESGAYSVRGIGGYCRITPEVPQGYNIELKDRSSEIEALPGQDKSVPDILLTPVDTRVYVDGQAVDETGRPVADAFIYYFCATQGGELRADTQGHFRIEGLPVTGDLMLWAATPGLASPTLGPLIVDTKGLEGVALVMKPEGSIAGTVVDTSGKGYGVYDWILSANREHGWYSNRVHVFPNGSFRFTGLAEGHYSLYLDKNPKVISGGIQLPNATVDLAAGQSITDLAIHCYEDGTKPRTLDEPRIVAEQPKEWKIEGKVLEADTGSPIPGFYVECEALGTSSSHETDGAFSCRANASSATLRVSAHGFLAAQQRVLETEAARGAANVVIRLARACVVEGRVLNPEGETLPGAKIHIGKLRDHDFGMESKLSYQSDADGAFRIDTLEPRAVRIYAEHPSYALGSIEVTPRPEASTRTDIVLTAGGALEGSVFLDGKPLTGSNVGYRSDAGDLFNRLVPVDAEGHYQALHLRPGPLEVYVSATEDLGSDWRMISRPAEIAEGQITRVDFDLAPARARIEGRITLNGEPPASTTVGAVFRRADAEEQIRCQANQQGEYETPLLPSGNVTLDVSAYGEDRTGLRTQRKASLADGQILRLDIDFTGSASISGALLHCAAPEKIQICAYAGSNLPSGDGLKDWVALASPADEGGTWRLSHLSPGTYTLFARAGWDSPNGASAVVTLSDGEHKDLDLDLQGVPLDE